MRPWFKLIALTALFLPAPLATAQMVQQLEDEFKRIAEQARACCMHVEVSRSMEATGFRRKDGETVAEPRSFELHNSLSGILLDSEGHVATLGEALKGAERIWVSRFTGNEIERYKADVVGFSLDSNVGLLRIRDGKPLDTLPMGDSDRIEQGGIVFGLGFTYNLGPSPSFSVGLVNATDRHFKFKNNQGGLTKLIQTSLAIHPGETGGPMINSTGEVVGLMLTSYAPPVAAAPGRGGFGGLVQRTRGFTLVMPINRVKKEVEWILAKQTEGPDVSMEVREGPWLGLTAGDISDMALRKQLRIPEGGVLVSYIFPGDPAARARILENDVLKSWNDVAIQGIDHLKKLVDKTRLGDQVKLIVIREGKSLKLKLHIGKY
jgi:serine protease Do